MSVTTETFPIERVREQFPLLAREVNGVPVAYLDSGASSERVLASIEAVADYERNHHSNVHRGSHTLSAEATAAYEGARDIVARHIGAADRREVIFVRNATEALNLVARAWGDANVGPGDRIGDHRDACDANLVPRNGAKWLSWRYATCTSRSRRSRSSKVSTSTSRRAASTP